MPILLALATILILPLPAAGQRPPVVPTRVLAPADTFTLQAGGQVVGTQTVSLERTEDGFLFRETTTTPRGHQTTEVRMDTGLAMRSVRQRGEMGGEEMRIDVTYGEGRARGSSRIPGAEGMEERVVDAPVPADVVDDNAMLSLLPAFPWSADATFELPVFASGMNALTTYRVRVVGTETVEGPDGPVEAFRVEMAGGDSPLTVLLSGRAPHRVLRLEVVGTPMVVERTGGR